VPIALSIVASALHGLHAAHETRGVDGELLGVVHRDVSPDNILIGVDGVARVLDFGVAKARGRLQATRDGRLKGKLGYMSPEQIHGHVSRQSDVYSASVVLWEALAGDRLFRASNGVDAVDNALHRLVPPPSERRRVLEDDLPWYQIDALTLRGVAREPEARFATARDMALALEEVVALAPPSEIGAWVERTMGEDIAVRARRLSELEREPVSLRGEATTEARPAPPLASVAQSSPSTLAHTPASDRRRRPLALPLALVAAGALAVLSVSHGLRSHGAPIETEPVALEPPVSPVDALPTEPPVVSLPVALSTDSASARPADRREPTKHALDTSRRSSTRSTPRKCDPPFVVDAEGNKRFKPECL
jgi:serine/threonine-protein kinase